MFQMEKNWRELIKYMMLCGEYMIMVVATEKRPN